MAPASSGFTSARTSTIGGRSTRARSTSITSEAPSTRTSSGGRRWRVPRRSVQFVTLAEEIMIVSLVCEDLAENDQVAEAIRAVGPTGVISVLLDGPQLTSRWAARYASVPADDPGSAVLTLTSFGMVPRSRRGPSTPPRSSRSGRTPSEASVRSRSSQARRRCS
jgi:hypothetical protein